MPVAPHQVRIKAWHYGQPPTITTVTDWLYPHNHRMKATRPKTTRAKRTRLRKLQRAARKRQR